MLDDMFTWGGEDFSRGTLDVRCEFDSGRNSIELEGAMPTTVPASSWRLAGAEQSLARRTLILAAFDLDFKLKFWQKKTPPVTGWRSNYAHLTEINIRLHCHRNVNFCSELVAGPLGRSQPLTKPHGVDATYLFGSRYIVGP
jgi:hypothetical protein